MRGYQVYNSVIADQARKRADLIRIDWFGAVTHAGRKLKTTPDGFHYRAQGNNLRTSMIRSAINSSAHLKH